MTLPLISVIVPVYKTEKHLRHCVQSIQNQTYEHLEIILVDDGSPDDSGVLCDLLAKEDARIQVIHKVNGGLSSARNAGLDIAKGEYISFVDSDDWICPDMYSRLFGLMQQHNAQIGIGGLQDSNGVHFNLDYPAKKDVEIFSRLDALREITRNQKCTNSFCDKLWPKSIFDQVRFPVGELYEDMKTIPACLELVDTLVYDPTPMYFYRMTGESITRGQFDPQKFEEAYAAKARAEYYQKKYPQLYEAALSDFVRTGIMKVWFSRGIPSCKAQRKDMIRQLRGNIPTGAIRLLSRNGQIKFYTLKYCLPLFHLAMAINERKTKSH